MQGKPSIRLSFVVLFILIVSLGAFGFWSCLSRKHKKEAELALRLDAIASSGSRLQRHLPSADTREFQAVTDNVNRYIDRFLLAGAALPTVVVGGCSYFGSCLRPSSNSRRSFCAYIVGIGLFVSSCKRE